MIFVGHPQFQKGFILYDPVSRQHFLTRNAFFHEKALVNRCYCPEGQTNSDKSSSNLEAQKSESEFMQPVSKAEESEVDERAESPRVRFQLPENGRDLGRCDTRGSK